MKNFLVIVFLALLVVAPAFTQQTKPQMKQQQMGDCQAMMERHKQMQTRMAEMDQKLNGLVQTMNAAKGDAKVEAVAAVVNELVDQRTKMHQMMASHQGMMMQHTGTHMQKGAGSMMHCPMMTATTQQESRTQTQPQQ